MNIIWFDVCAICVLVSLAYAMIIRRGVWQHQNIIFSGQCICVFVTALAGLISAIAQNQVKAGVESFFTLGFSLNFFSFLYMGAHILTPVLFVAYIYAILGVNSMKRQGLLKLFLPVGICYLALLSTPLTKAIFYYDAEKNYVRGPLLVLFYLGAVYYLGYSIRLLLRYQEDIRRDFRLALYSFAWLSVAGAAVQYVLPVFRVENFFNSLVLLMLYIAIERPADYVDPQTDLQNAYAFQIRSGVAFRRGMGFTLLLVTIDNVEELDKHFGARNVDLLIAEAARYLEIFSGIALPYRLERNCFALWFREGRQGESSKVIDLIRERFSQTFEAENYNINMFECCTLISCPEDAGDIDRLNRLIRLASNPAYHKSRHFFEISEEDVNSNERRREIGLMLRTAVMEKRISLLFQPVYSAAESAFTQVKVYTELRMGGQDVVHGEEAMPVAEKNGTATEIYRYVFDRLCGCIAESGAKERGYSCFLTEIPVTVLMAGEGPDWIVETAQSHGVPFDMIAFELNQRVLMAYDGTVETNILLLKEAGFGFTLVNYGNGYTDAGTVLRMPLSEVSLDPALTGAALSKRQASVILQCTVDMLRRFRLRIRADELKNEELKEYALSLGCDFLRGDVLCRAMNAGTFLEYLKGGGHAVF